MLNDVLLQMQDPKLLSRKLEILLLLILAILVLYSPAQSKLANPVSPEVLTALQSKKEVSVIILLEETFPQSAPLRTQIEGISNTQNKVLATLEKSDFTLKHAYNTTPALAGKITQSGIEKLKGNPKVRKIGLDKLRQPVGEIEPGPRPTNPELTESVPLTNTDDVHAMGITGSGVTVAVIDTGIDPDHPDLSDDIVAEHCFTDGDCPPNNTDESTSAKDDRNHGTSVSGIITSSGNNGIAPKGIAPDAGIAAIRVCDSGGTCWSSDIVAAIDWSVTNKDNYDISVINISLGGGPYSGICDDESAAIQAEADAINTARNNGIITFASSGNDGSGSKLSAPACTSGAVSAGSVYDDNVGGSISWGDPVTCTDNTTEADKVTCFTNSNSYLNLMAPGAFIDTTTYDDWHDEFHGTSSAAPHTSAAAALLVDKKSSLSPDEIQNVLENTGISVTDSKNGLSFPRIDTKAAVLSVSNTSFQVEVGQVTLDHNWTTVNLSKTFTDPVVVAKPLSYNGHQPATVRIKNVTSTSFEIKIQEWEYLDGTHVDETLGYIVMEKGHFTLGNGLEVEAGSINTNATGSFTNVNFYSTFPSKPVVITSVTTFNGPDTVDTRNENISTTGFQVMIQEQEAKTQYHTTETVSYIAWEEGTGTADGRDYEVGRSGNSVTHEFYTVSFGFGKSSSIQVDEEQSGDNEINHITEDVGYIAFNTSPLILVADMQTTDGGNTANLRYESDGGSFGNSVAIEVGQVTLDHNWTTVSLSKSFTNPIVVAKPFLYEGHHPGVIRIKNVTSTSFDIRIQEWEYKDGWHTQETVSYIVMEKGHYTLDSGLEVEAGLTNTNATGSFANVNFSSGFPTTPVVITTVTTFNGPDAVATRNESISTSGFQVMMQEQEAHGQSHITETISYIAWEPGSGTVDGKAFEVVSTGDEVTDAFFQINFSQSFSNPPAFIADMQITDGPNTANLRCRNKSASSVEVQVDEEQSGDSETNHTTEVIGYIAIEAGSSTATVTETNNNNNFDLKKVYNYPNPVTGTETTTFVAQGLGIQKTKVEIYDLAGSKVFESQWNPGNQVKWDTETNSGRLLANGVYLYLVKVKGKNGEQEISKVRKVVVLR